MEQAVALVNQAVAADQAGRTQQAVNLYADAAEAIAKALRFERNEQVRRECQARIEQCLQRAEFLKSQLPSQVPSFPSIPSPKLPPRPHAQPQPQPQLQPQPQVHRGFGARPDGKEKLQQLLGALSLKTSAPSAANTAANTAAARLSDAQKREFVRNGFLTIEHVVPQALRDRAMRAINRSIAKQMRSTDAPLLPSEITSCAELVTAPSIVELLTHSPALSYARDLIGPTNDVWAAQIALRFPGDGCINPAQWNTPTPIANRLGMPNANAIIGNIVQSIKATNPLVAGVIDQVSMHSALCTMHYALCTMHYALCTMRYALCTMHYALCTMHYALCSMHYAHR
jgi:hypothetical protein